MTIHERFRATPKATPMFFAIIAYTRGYRDEIAENAFNEPFVSDEQDEAIEVALLNRFAENLGQHYPVAQDCFTPEERAGIEKLLGN